MERIFSSKKPIITLGIILLCIVMFIISGYGYDDLKLIRYGANYSFLVRRGEYFRLITYMFLHGELCILFLICILYILLVLR